MKRVHTPVDNEQSITIHHIPDELIAYIISLGLSHHDRADRAMEVEREFLRDMIHLSLVNRTWYRVVTTIVVPLVYTSFDDLIESMHYTEWLFKLVAHRFTVIELSTDHYPPMDNSHLVCLTNLRRLYIDGNLPISEKTFRNLTTLRELCLYDNSTLLNRTGSLIPIWNLEKLELVRSSFPLGEEECRKMTRLHTLELYDNQSYRSDTQTFTRCLTSLCTLTLFNVRYLFDSDSFVCLTNLTSLSLTKCGTSCHFFPSIFTNLTSLVVDFQVFNPDTFPRLTTLTALSLNTPRDKALVQWGPSVVFPPHLTYLNIDNASSFNDTHLSVLTSLTSLSVKNCTNVTGTCLQSLTRLTTLVLDGTSVSSFDLLRPLHMLTSLGMCMIGDVSPLTCFTTLPSLSQVVFVIEGSYCIYKPLGDGEFTMSY